MRIVIKIGTSTLAYQTGLLNIKRVEEMCKVISDLKNAGHEIVLVSSGAIGLGMGKLRIDRESADIPTKQAAASVGQCELMSIYEKGFAEYNHTVAQILITGAFANLEGYSENLDNTLSRLLELGLIPIVNENDTVATDEIVIGDNDTLGAIIANKVGADLLILLSDIDGLYTGDPNKDPNAKRIEIVEDITDEIKNLAQDRSSVLGTGGMITKIHAAELVTSRGIEMVVANGRNPAILYDILEGGGICTRFKPIQS